MTRRLLALSWLSVGALTSVWLIISLLGDRAWWALPFLFGPRWIWWAAFAGTVPALLASPRRGALPALIVILIQLFGILDVRLGLHRFTAPAGPSIRVMELNADGNSGNAALVLAEIRARTPDIMAIAECGETLKDSLAHLEGYHLHTAMTSICLLARGEISEWAERDPSHDIWQEGGAGAMARATVQTSAGPVRFGLLHLETPRSALQMYVDKSEILKQGPTTRQNMVQREKESSLAEEWMKGGRALPTIVAGDFNLPIESAIYRRHWGGYRNAFSQVGIGSGHTKRTRLWGARIDHILSDDGVVPVRSSVGPDVGSDHRPLIADLVLSGATGRAPPDNR